MNRKFERLKKEVEEKMGATATVSENSTTKQVLVELTEKDASKIKIAQEIIYYGTEVINPKKLGYTLLPLPNGDCTKLLFDPV